MRLTYTPRVSSSSAPARLCFRAGLTLLAALHVFLGACGSGEPISVLLIVSDTFRADAFDCDAAPRATPNLCKLASQSTRFTRAYTNAPWTLPSSAAMMGGNSAAIYVRERADDPSALRFRIPASEVLLAEALAERGYETRNTVENTIASHSKGLAGLRQWKLPAEGPREPDPRIGFDGTIHRHVRMIPALVDLTQPRQTPFFGLYWFRDPHAPYRPPEKHFARLPDLSLPRPASFYLGLGHGSFPDREERKLRNVLPDLSAAELTYLRTLYRTEVASIDERVGNLLDALELSGRRQNTVVVFTSDHGEGFGEHGYFLHGETFFDEVTRVPLLISGPGVRAGAKVDAPVSLVDLMPTLADLLDVECLDRPQGRSLVPLLEGKRSPELESRAHYIVNPIREPGADAVVWDRYKLITKNNDASLELYDLLADPDERVDLATREPAILGKLLRFARGMREENQRRLQEQLAAEAGRDGALASEDEKTQRDLKAIGYVD